VPGCHGCANREKGQALQRLVKAWTLILKKMVNHSWYKFLQKKGNLVIILKVSAGNNHFSLYIKTCPQFLTPHLSHIWDPFSGEFLASGGANPLPTCIGSWSLPECRLLSSISGSPADIADSAKAGLAVEDRKSSSLPGGTKGWDSVHATTLLFATPMGFISIFPCPVP